MAIKCPLSREGGIFSAFISAPITFSVASVRVQIMYIDLQRLQRVKNNLLLLASHVTGVAIRLFALTMSGP